RASTKSSTRWPLKWKVQHWDKLQPPLRFRMLSSARFPTKRMVLLMWFILS
ncbi:MTA/SAH nucleosidase, partial [Vibrio parahaemolyticus V-223/04]